MSCEIFSFIKLRVTIIVAPIDRPPVQPLRQQPNRDITAQFWTDNTQKHGRWIAFRARLPRNPRPFLFARGLQISSINGGRCARESGRANRMDIWLACQRPTG